MRFILSTLFLVMALATVIQAACSDNHWYVAFAFFTGVTGRYAFKEWKRHFDGS